MRAGAASSLTEAGVLIVDFGSQVTQLIARRVREAGVYCEIAPFNAADAAFERLKPKGIILSGGPSSVMWEDSPRAPQHLFEAACRCSASATASRPWRSNWAASSRRPTSREFGRAFIEISGETPLFDGLWKSASATRCG
jgi:GMP synthase (glutamine-hydrolysing)